MGSHYARDRSSFKTYQPIEAERSGPLSDSQVSVVGIGTVELEVRTGFEKRAPTRTLVLDDVQHIPDAVCNSFSVAQYHGKHGGSNPWFPMEGWDEEKRPLWSSVPLKEGSYMKWKLALAGEPKGPSYLRDGAVYSLSVY